MNDSRLSSSPIHVINHEFEETAINTPRDKVERNSSLAGREFNIKKRNQISWMGYEPISLFLADLFHLGV